MRAAPRGRVRAAGFTLVELLLALTLMSMLLALTYGGMRAATRATDKGQQVLEDSSRIRMAHQFVRRQLNQMLPLAYAAGETPEERVVFQGDARSIRFVAPMPGYLGFGGPQVQELTFEQGEESLDLVLTHALLQDFDEAYLYEQEPIFLLGEIQDARFAFLDRDETGAPSGWVDRWEPSAQLPAAVSLEIEFEEEVYIRWPLLATSVRVDGLNAGVVSDLQGGARRGYSDRIRDMINRQGRKE